MPTGVPQITVAVRPSAKPWWQSRTLWFNTVCMVAAAAEANLGVIQSRLPGGLYAWLAFVMPIGNIVLRTFTAAAIAGVQHPCPAVPPDAPQPPAAAPVDSLPDPLKGCT